MIDHLSIGIDDVGAAAEFYGPVLQSLDYKELLRAEWGVGYGRERIVFIAIRPYDERPASVGNGVHVAFEAESKAQVDAFHRAALELGGRCAGPPGPRPALGENAYAAFVNDPTGHKLEAIFGGFAS